MTISLAAEPIFHIGSFPITNTLISSWIAMGVLIGISLILRRKIREVPRGLQNAVEAIFEVLLNLMDSVTGDRAKSKQYFPLITTILLFIITANWMGLLPGFGPIGIYEMHHGEEVLVPFFRSSNSDLNVTLALAIISVLSMQFFGILAIGFVKYSKRFVNFRNPIMGFVGIVEFISDISKVLSFSFRLFGNVFAGEVLLVIVASLVPLIAPIPFYFLEIFVGFIQAFVFAILTLVFIKIASLEPH
ncbi:MAG: F0F1 ATP synthase subunit A [bacterium]